MSPDLDDEQPLTLPGHHWDNLNEEVHLLLCPKPEKVRNTCGLVLSTLQNPLFRSDPHRERLTRQETVGYNCSEPPSILHDCVPIFSLDLS